MDVYLLTMRNLYILFLLFLTVDSIKITECQLMFKQTKQSHKNLFKPAILLTITVLLANSTNLPECVVKNSDLIQPLQWKRISGTQGKGLLQLQPFYEMLSLSLLSYRTEEKSIILQSKPPGCLENLNELEYELVFRNFLLNFTREKDEICNEHIGKISKYARFYHECCHYDHNGKMQCNHVLKNKWMLAIEYCTYIVIIIVVLYCPLLIPSSLYDPNYGPKKFMLCLKDSYSFTMKKTLESNPVWDNILKSFNKQRDDENTVVPYAKLKGMKKFKEKLKKMENDKTYLVKVSKVYFNVRADEIVSANEVSVSLFKAFYNLFLKCDIRKQEGVSTCCEANMFGKCLQSRINYQWYKLFRFLVRIVLLAALCLPWIIRICIFYVYESEIRETRYKAAETKNLLVRLDHSIAYYGTPLHILFILSYALICFGCIILELTSVLLLKNVKRLVRDVLTKCFHGICSRSKRDVFGRTIKVLLHPFSEKGIFGIFCLIPYWICAVPLRMAVSCYYFFPAVYIAVNFICLIVDIFRKCSCNLMKVQSNKHTDTKTNLYILQDIYSDIEKGTMHHSLSLSTIEIGLMFILLCLMLSSLLLTVELVIFLMKIAIYTMVGLILNSSHAMQYVTTISLAWLYYNRCFGGISQIYESYNKAVQTILYKENKRQVDEIAEKELNEQENMAFEVKGSQIQRFDPLGGTHKNNRQIVIGNNDEVPKFRTKGVILLLDQFDKQYITQKFFFKVCKIEPDGPGPLSEHFLVAMRRFGIIFIFLIFVTLVVLAFGDSYSVSFNNQLLATLAGGVVPWILMKTKILFTQATKQDVGALVDRYSNADGRESLQLQESGTVSEKGIFRKNFNKVIREDKKWWNINDMDVTIEEQTNNAEKCDFNLVVNKNFNTTERV